MTDTHPLASDGALKFLADDAALFAADILNGAGVPVTPRQLPFEKSIGLYLSVGAAPDRGAYVDLIVEPPGAVRLLASDDGTCVALPGAFRCTAGADGFASFFARSESGYSGTLAIQVVGRTEEQPLTIRPAGIPDGTSDFVLLVSGIAGNRVPAKYNRLECTLAPMPDQSFDKWPAGAIRVREAQIRATPPTFSPASLEHAPVLIESLHPEAFVSLEPDCLPPHASRLRVQLDAVGQSPPFFFCFSDLGGNVPVAYASGDTKGDSLTLSVDPEPRLLRVVTADATLSLDPLVLVKVLELSAFDSDLNQLALKVDVTSSDPEVFSLVDATVKLPGADEGDVPLSVFGRALAAGKVTLSVSPALYITPSCASLPIVVEP
ncbi:MAG: hypothetical protein EXR75_16810 [Myxococcales bacterium]|nr:hypothetical protein [Myxococcales bacterium]